MSHVRTNVACLDGVNTKSTCGQRVRRGRRSGDTSKNCTRGCRNSTPVTSRRTSPNSPAPTRRSFGLVIATVDGHVYEVGATRQQFTIQSISKPLIYGVALEDRGSERVSQAIGVEPSGDAFNSISLEPGTGRPLNPMINAGAIATSSLVAGATAEARVERVVGRDFRLRRPRARRSTRRCSNRNAPPAIATAPSATCCATTESLAKTRSRRSNCTSSSVRFSIDCRDLAMIGATLANGGINPVTGARAVRSEFVDPILSVMTTCGMYDFAGEWVYRVGMPAKSGVGGGIVAVLPGPARHRRVFAGARRARQQRARRGGVRSVVERSRSAFPASAAALGFYGSRALHAWPRFARSGAGRRTKPTCSTNTAHVRRCTSCRATCVLRRSSASCARSSTAVPRSTSRCSISNALRTSTRPATRMLAALTQRCAAEGQHLVFTRVRRGESARVVRRGTRSESGRRGDVSAAARSRPRVVRTATAGALCGASRRCVARRVAGASPLCGRQRAPTLRTSNVLVERREFEPGALIVHRGDPADALYFLVKGDVSVVVDLPKGGYKRLVHVDAGHGVRRNGADRRRRALGRCARRLGGRVLCARRTTAFASSNASGRG